MNVIDVKSLLRFWFEFGNSPVDVKSRMIMDAFARFYRVPASIFTKIEMSAMRNFSLKEAQIVLERIQQELSESNEANEVVTSIDALMEIVAEKVFLGVGEELPWRRQFVQNWKIIRPKLSEVGIKTDEFDAVIGNWSIQSYVGNYIKQSTWFLRSLERDIRLVATMNASDWNPSIFQEVYDLICFLYRLFETVLDDPRFSKDTREDLDSAFKAVELAWAGLFQGNSENPRNKALILQCGQAAWKDFSWRFPAKSIKELWILNELSRRALSGDLMVKRRSRTEEEKKRHISSALDEIQRELQSFNENFEEAYDENLTWTPKTVAIVLDLETGFLLTGGSQMSCRDHPLLRQAAIEIPCLQIGAAFESVMAQCNADWIKKYEFLYGEDFETRKRILQEEERLPMYAQLPAKKGAYKIFSWAFSGFTLEAKSPCPRCSYFYPSWDTEKCEDYMQPEYFDTYFRGKTKGLTKNHCAETIAAAAIYAWRESKLVLD